MRLRRGSLVFLPDLDGLVAFCGDHPERGSVEEDVVDGGFTREGAGLQWRLNLLKVISALPVEEVE